MYCCSFYFCIEIENFSINTKRVQNRALSIKSIIYTSSINYINIKKIWSRYFLAVQIFWKFPTSTIYVLISFHNLSEGKTQNLFSQSSYFITKWVREGETSGVKFIINIYNFPSWKNREKFLWKVWRNLYKGNWYDFIFHQNELLKGLVD